MKWKQFSNNRNSTTSVCISRYPLAKNLDILKWKSSCYSCLQKLSKVYLWYCGSTSNYSTSNSHASKEWMVTLVSHTRSKECLLISFSIYVTPLTLSSSMILHHSPWVNLKSEAHYTITWSFWHYCIFIFISRPTSPVSQLLNSI